MTTNTKPVTVKITDQGTIALPDYIRQAAGLELGDELVVVWSPPDTILVRKLSEVAADDDAFAGAMQAFDQALRQAGYESDDDVVALVREVKAEQVAAWNDEP